MDTLAHGLIGGAVFGKTRDEKQIFIGGLMGMMPDIIIFSTVILGMGLSKGLDFIVNPNPVVPKIYVDFYYVTHSLIIALVIAAILFLIKHKWVFFVIPYILHILVDVPFHCGLFATRIFYPFNAFHVCGVDYTEHIWLWEISYGALVGIYYFIYIRYYKPYLKVPFK